MAQRTRRQAAVARPTPEEVSTAVTATERHPPPLNPTPPSLEHVRADSLRQRADSERTISELKAWRDEIDATIAFLEAQRK